MGIFVISIIFMVAGMIVGAVLKRRMNKYAQIGSSSGLTGKEIAGKPEARNFIARFLLTLTGRPTRKSRRCERQ